MTPTAHSFPAFQGLVIVSRFALTPRAAPAPHVSRFTIDGSRPTFTPMSIVTKTGDLGATGLMYNRRVSKSHARVEAYGTVDELNAALGLARATAEQDFIRDSLLGIQKGLVTLMGELATGVEDLPRYVKDGYSLVTAELTQRLEKWVREIESQNVTCQGWATPGATLNSAALEAARSTCRRAERRVC